MKQLVTDIERRAELELARRVWELVRDLPKIVELERSGVRDGDGSWHGSDSLGGTLYELSEMLRKWREALGTLKALAHSGDTGEPPF